MTMLSDKTTSDVSEQSAPIVKLQRVGEEVRYGNVTDWLYVSNIPNDAMNGKVFTDTLPAWAAKMPAVGEWLYVPTTTTKAKKARNRRDAGGWTKEERAAAREEERRIRRENSARARQEARRARQEARRAREEARRIAALQKAADRVRRENRQHMGRYGLPRTIAIFDLANGEHWRWQILAGLAVQNGQRYIVRYRVADCGAIREYNPTHAADWLPQLASEDTRGPVDRGRGYFNWRRLREQGGLYPIC